MTSEYGAVQLKSRCTLDWACPTITNLEEWKVNTYGALLTIAAQPVEAHESY
jgi:hypothetical protein